MKLYSEMEKVRVFHPARRLRPYYLPLALLAISLFLVVAYVLTKELSAAFPNSRTLGMLTDEFNLEEEGNFPAWFSTVLWLMAAAKCFKIAKADGQSSGFIPNRVNWIAMAGVSTFLSLDEATSIHERIGALIDQKIGTDMPFYSWELYGVAFTLTVVALLLPFLWKLPRYFSATVILAGAVFLSGAVGMENLGALVENGYLVDFPARLDWTGALLLEEGLEMLGVILFYAALCGFWQARFAELHDRGWVLLQRV